nr:transposase [Thermoflavimicrobium daqui]
MHKVVKYLKGYTSRMLRREFSHLKSRILCFIRMISK